MSVLDNECGVESYRPNVKCCDSVLISVDTRVLGLALRRAEARGGGSWGDGGGAGIKRGTLMRQPVWMQWQPLLSLWSSIQANCRHAPKIWHTSAQLEIRTHDPAVVGG